MTKIQVKEYFYLAWRNLRTRSLRSWLTILGIVIGVFLIVSLLSLSEGIKDNITQQLQALGGEIIFVMPGDMSDMSGMMGMYMGAARLEKADIDAIKRTPGVDTVLVMSYASMVMRYSEESKNVIVIGQPWDEGIEILERFQGWSLAQGRWPVSGRREIIIGHHVASKMFGEKVRINEEITLKGRRFTVVGSLNSLGNRTDDSAIYLDMPLYQDLTGEPRGTAHMAFVQIKEGVSLERVAEDLRINLQETRKRRIGTDEADFSVVTSDTMEELAGNILAVIQIAIIAFASIAIVVGGIGITNTMFTSVKERTREIGIMKAVGAKNSAVLSMFLIEAGIIGIVGGIGGTILGTIASLIVEHYARDIMFSTSITFGLIAFSLSFSFLIGCLAGFFPARKAAKLKPVEALREYH